MELKEKRPTICNVLKSLRIINELSIKQLSDKSGISVSYITELEKGNKTKPSLEILDKYSKALGIKKTTIMYFQEEMEDKNYDFQEILYKVLKKRIVKENLE